MRKIVLATMFVAVLALPAAAQQSVDESRSVSPDATVTIECISGSIAVTGWDRNEVRVTGTLGRGIERLDVTGSGGRLDIRVVYPHNCEDCGGADLEIQVPAGSRPEVETVSANIDATGLRGDVRLESVSGNVVIDTAGSVRAKTVSGEVKVKSGGPDVDASSVSGDLEITAATLKDAEFETVSGDIRIDASSAPQGRLEAKAVSGDIELRIPAGAGADFDVSTFSGDIRNELGPEPRRKSEHGPGMELRFQSGDGSARLYLKSFSGDVRILRK
jgi:hypothetical protein